MYAPYDQPTYQLILDLLHADDVVLDIGAGDLRLSHQMARIVPKVYAVESNASVLDQAPASSDPGAGRVIPICADARVLKFPSDVTVGVLMMRHCLHFGIYFKKLRNAGARRLITNARWRMSVETVDVWKEHIPWQEAGMGWYACQCGGTGFQEGPAEQWTADMDRVIHEVVQCPRCRQN